MELSQAEVFRILTEDGKYTGITQEKYKRIHLGDMYIESGTLEHTKTTNSVIYRQILSVKV